MGIKDPGYLKSVQKKVGGFFGDPVETTKTELGNLGQQLKAGPLAGGTPQTDIASIVQPQDTTNPYATAAEQGIRNVQTLGSKLGELYGTGAGAMTGLIGQLQGQTRGYFGAAGSLGQQLLQQGMTKNLSDVRTQLASQRGLSPALAASIAATKQAELGGQTTQQAGILGLQQQMAAQSQLAGLSQQAATLGSEGQLRALNQLATSDVAMRQLIAQTGLAKEEIAARIAAANQAAAAGDKQALVKFFTSMGSGAADTSAAQTLIPGLAKAAPAAPAAPTALAAGGAGAAGGAAAAAPLAVAASDERTKKDISNISGKDLNEFLSAVNPVSFDYKEPQKYGEGDKVGFLMQDVADTKIGNMIQRPLPDGKMGYDPQSLQGVILAALAKNKAHGGRIDGMAPYDGDTPKNDIVPAQLSPGEIVIPRSAAGSKKDAKSFIEALTDWDEEPSYSKVLQARQKKKTIATADK